MPRLPFDSSFSAPAARFPADFPPRSRLFTVSPFSLLFSSYQFHFIVPKCIIADP